jgi:hypothetical protein
VDLAAEQPGDLAADGQPQAGPPVLAAGAAVGLLEGLEDDLLLLEGDADAGIRHREGQHRLGLSQPGAVRERLGPHRADLEGDPPAPGELEGVGE